jgi:hypothetical protein
MKPLSLVVGDAELPPAQAVRGFRLSLREIRIAGDL